MRYGESKTHLPIVQAQLRVTRESTEIQQADRQSCCYLSFPTVFSLCPSLGTGRGAFPTDQAPLAWPCLARMASNKPASPVQAGLWAAPCSSAVFVFCVATASPSSRAGEGNLALSSVSWLVPREQKAALCGVPSAGRGSSLPHPPVYPAPAGWLQKTTCKN